MVWIKCRKYKNHKPNGWEQGNIVVWDNTLYPKQSVLFFNPETHKLWKWVFNADVLQGQNNCVVGNTNPTEYAVLSHTEISWK